MGIRSLSAATKALIVSKDVYKRQAGESSKEDPCGMHDHKLGDHNHLRGGRDLRDEVLRHVLARVRDRVFDERDAQLSEIHAGNTRRIRQKRSWRHARDRIGLQCVEIAFAIEQQVSA